MIQKRGQDDIWAGLYQFYLVENDSLVAANAGYLKQVLQNQLAIESSQLLATTVSAPVHQLLTHQRLVVRFVEVDLASKPAAFSKAIWVPKTKLSNYPFPKIIVDFLKQV